jgi:hypothetical protein
MLSPLDDYPGHQVPEPFSHVGPSDRNFFERYYFSCHDLEGRLFMVLAFGQYPNLGVTDAFVSVVYGGKQQVVRASRELGSNRLDTKVGPIKVEILEGMRRLRIVLEPNEWDLEYDLTFEASAAAHLEPRFFRRQRGRVTQDYLRTTQTGRYSGWIKVAGERIEVTPDSFWGQRDHSWGIRPVGEADPALRRPGGGGGGTFFWNWACVQLADSSILYTVSEEADGSRWNDSCARVYPVESGREADLLQVHHQIEFLSGTRQFKRATLDLTDKGGRRVKVECEPLTVLWMSGCGYGGDWRHGMYQGPFTVQGITHDLKDPETLRKLSGLHDTVCRFSVDGEVGYGVFELLVAGVYPRYGFNTPMDVAP